MTKNSPPAFGILHVRSPPDAMTLGRTAFLSGVSAIVRLLAALAATKVIALRMGPEALALVGQFGGFTAMAGFFATGGITLGVVKYTAEHANDPEQRAALFATAIRITIACSLLSGACIVLLNAPLSRLLLGTPDYAAAFTMLGLCLPLFALNAFLLAVMNGVKEVQRLISLNILGSVLALLLTLVLVLQFGTLGALAAIATAPGAAFAVTALAARGRPWMRHASFAPPLDRAMLRRLAGFSAMAAATVVTLPLSGILIRTLLASSVSLEAAGHWQGVWQLSEGYLLVASTSLSVYYLPRLSEITDPAELRREVTRGYLVILPVTILTALGVYVFREPIVRLLFSEQFLPMIDLMAFQLVGDVLKIASWLLSYLMVARARTKLFVATEIIFSVTFVGMSVLLVPGLGVHGVVYAFAANYLCYLVSLAWIFRREIGLSK